jgi:uncharacterized protein
MIPFSQIYTGTVVHKRLRPKQHALSYGVFSLLLDLDHIDETAAGSRLFSRNRFNILSFYDSDHGPGDGTRADVHARELFAAAGVETTGLQLLMLAYPRVLGYVFNPISVYYAMLPSGGLAGLIYEVNNTWGERRSYVVHAGDGQGRLYGQSARKELHVSPFAAATGKYGFRVTVPAEDLLVGVQLSDLDGALLKTHFKGQAAGWSDRRLAGLLFRFPLLTLKIISAIHVEALKLWLKGVPLSRGQSNPGYSISYVPRSAQSLKNESAYNV